jgi:hypothetical protein
VKGAPAARCSAHRALELVAPDLSRVLVSERALSRILALAARFPELGGAQYLECRLAPPRDPPVDLLISVERRSLSRKFPRRRGAAGMTPFRRLTRCFASGTSALCSSVPVAWLEFDRADRPSSAGANVCVCAVPSYVDPFAPIGGDRRSELPELLNQAAATIRRRALTCAERGCIERCIGALPAGAHFIHFSVMTARRPPELKLYGVFPRSGLLHYLTEIAWNGCLSTVEGLLERHCGERRTGGSLYVDLPLRGLLEPGRAALGIVFSQQQLRVSGERELTWRTLLRELCDAGLCTEERAAALARWPRAGTRCRAAGGFDAVVKRWLDLKLVYRRGQRPFAKAYLGFAADRGSGRRFTREAPGWLSPAACRRPRPVARTSRVLE